MPLEVITNDASSLTDADLDEMGSIEGAFDIGAISKAKEDWVLTTAARIDGKLHGFMFSTLERIGGTPCVLIGMLSVRRHSKRETVMRGLMGEAYHRALMAFPDEDVVVGSRFVSADGLEAFDKLDEVTPAPDSRAVGVTSSSLSNASRPSADTKRDPTTTSSSGNAIVRGGTPHPCRAAHHRLTLQVPANADMPINTHGVPPIHWSR